MPADDHPSASSGKSPQLVIAAAFLFPLLLFRAHLLGAATWIGNSDRLNSNLKVLSFYLRGIFAGHLSAWNEHEMLGYDAFALPYTFPNPLTWLSGAGGLSNLPITAGYISIALLILAGLSAYAFLRSLHVSTSAAIVGVALYQLTALPVLKVSQNDTSFLVFLVIPLALCLLRRVSRESLHWFFIALVALFFAMLHVMFLQKAAYALMLCGSYACWRSFVQRNWRTLVYFCGATAVAILLAMPRLIGIAQAMAEYARVAGDHNLRSFADVYRFQNIHPYQIYRWLDPTMFGVSPSDPVALQNNINLSEGFLLGNTVAVPLLLLMGLIAALPRWRDFLRRDDRDLLFWIGVLIATFSVILCRISLEALYYAFGQLDFTHARILIIGLSALVAIVAVLLTRYQPAGAMRMRTVLIGIAIAGAALFCIEHGIAHQSLKHPMVKWGWEIRHDAALRAIYTSLLCIGLFVGRLCSRKVAVQQLCYSALCAVMVGQTFLAANMQVNGAQTVNQATPFDKGDMFMAHRDQFLVPNDAQVAQLDAKVHTQAQRVILICDPAIAGGFCAGHIPEAWQLRAVDGYYGLGVPRRIRALPWENAVGLRTLSFTSLKGINWPLLGLLNVGGAVEVSPELFENRNAQGAPADPARVQIVPNPARVTPRAFFAQAIEPVTSPEEAAGKLIQGTHINSPEQTSYVEGITEAQEFRAAGPVQVQGANDRLTVNVPPAQGPRFLVLNELVFPGWHAFVDGAETPIYPTNAFMRGVLLPASARVVTFEYWPYVGTRPALIFYLAGLVLFVIGTVICYRKR